MEKSTYSIFKTFFKIGTLLLGGGYVILPLLQAEIVYKKQWLEEDELCEYYALAQSVPGIIAVNTSIFTGYKLKGQIGAVAAVTGVILPAFAAIIIIATILQEVMNLNFINSIFYGVGIGVIMLLLLAIKDMWYKSIVDKFTCGIFILAFVLSACFKISPAIIILLTIIIGLIFRNRVPDISDEYEEEAEE